MASTLDLSCVVCWGCRNGSLTSGPGMWASPTCWRQEEYQGKHLREFHCRLLYLCGTSVLKNICSRSHSRIHISRATLDCLNGIFKTEDGHGRDRNEFLRKHNIDTYLICPQEERGNVDHTEHPRVQKTSHSWHPEFPFKNVVDMNSVSAEMALINKAPCVITH